MKDRSAKVRKRRNAMPVNGRGAFIVQGIIEAKAAEARRNADAAKKIKR